MPFCLKNVEATYQRLVTKIFRPLLSETMEVNIDNMIVKSKNCFDHIKHLQEAFIAKVQHETQPFEMYVWSQFRQIFRLYGDPKRDRGQSYPTQSYNGFSSFYLQKRSTTTYWPTGSSWAVHISFHMSIKTIFCHSKGTQKRWFE